MSPRSPVRLLCAAACVLGLALPSATAFAFRAVAVSTFQKVRPESRPEGKAEIALSAARGEREAFQLALLPEGKAVPAVVVTASPLRHARAGFRIPADRVELRLEGYTEVKGPSWRGFKQPGRWPDPLLEMRPFDIPANESRCVWGTVHVPEDAPAGDYAGSVTVQGGGGAKVVAPLSLHVWGFGLPRQVHLATSYWMSKGWITPLYPEQEGLRRGDLAAWKPLYDVFGRYRLCTDVWVEPRYLRNADGSYLVDLSRFAEHFGYFARTWRPSVLQVGCGCWGGSTFESIPTYDAATGRPLQVRDEKTGKLVPRKADLSSGEAMRLFFDALRPHIQACGMEGRVYLQLWDEPARDTWDWGVRAAYANLFQAAPDIPGLCVVGIHPQLQGAFDIFCPHTMFADATVYRQLRQGVSLARAKAMPAEATASSTGGWGNAACYTYQPSDAYDGCAYTAWTSKEPPTPQKPEWLQLAFRKPTRVDGVRLVPKEGLEPVDWSLAVSADGRSFTDVALKPDAADRWTFRFDPVEASAVRLTFRAANQKAAEQPAPRGVGLREVEFLGPNLPREETIPRQRVPKMRVWEYNVGADYPSFCIDSPAVEHRAIAWLAWERGLEGFLYYGGGWFPEEWKPLNLPAAQPLDWPAHGTNGGQYLIYPGRGNPPRPLPSIRLAMMGEGMEDYEYLWLLRESLVAARLDSGRHISAVAIAAGERLLAEPLAPVRSDADRMMAHRRHVAEAIEALGRAGR